MTSPHALALLIAAVATLAYLYAQTAASVLNNVSSQLANLPQ